MDQRTREFKHKVVIILSRMEGVKMNEFTMTGEPVTWGTRHDSNETVDKEKRYKQILCLPFQEENISP